MLKVSSYLGLITLVIITMLLVSACAAFEDPAQRATENAQNTAMWTMVYGFQTEMPTMEALALTADSAVFLSTQVAAANAQNEYLRATNAALLSGGVGQPAATAFIPPTAIGGGQVSGAFPTASTNTGSDPILLTPNATPAVGGSTLPGSTRFAQAVMAAAIDDDGCASGISNSFTASATAVYFVVTALDLQPGIEFTLRVTGSGGTIVASDPGFWTSNDVYDQTCIWYNIDRSTMDFFAGTYSAELLANDQSVATATFVITGSDTGATDEISDEMVN